MDWDWQSEDSEKWVKIEEYVQYTGKEKGGRFLGYTRIMILGMGNVRWAWKLLETVVLKGVAKILKDSKEKKKQVVTKFSGTALTKTIGTTSDVGGRKGMEQQATGNDANKRNTKIQ